MKEMRILSPTAILGYGFPRDSFDRGMARRPHVMGFDAGSSDPGPYYLGSGKCFVDRGAVKRDLAIGLAAARRAGIPVVVGTAGGSGARIHVDWCLRIVRELAREERLRLRTAVIYSDVSRALVRRALAAGRVRPLSFVPELTAATLGRAGRVVAQIGMEPLIAALCAGADLVLAGRCYDPAVFAAPAVMNGFDPGLAVHLGKIVECAAIAASPGSGRDCVLGVLGRRSFTLEPLSGARRFTVASVSAHTMYEKSHPYLLPGPGGVLDLSQVRFRQLDKSRVEVRGSRFVPGAPTVKIEGAVRAGWRTFSICGIRDRVMLGQLDGVFGAVRAAVENNFGREEYRLQFRVYGRDAVMGGLEPERGAVGHEVGVVIDAVAPSQGRADTICGFARSTMLHYGYPGRIATAGNLAFPFSPSDFPAGPVYEFGIYHVMEIDDPARLFPARFVTFGGRR
jgi:hypothetical protein